MSNNVKFNIPERRVGKVPIEFKVIRNKEVLGTLRIHIGRIVWVPKNAHKGTKLSWMKFAELMKMHGTKEK